MGFYSFHNFEWKIKTNYSILQSFWNEFSMLKLFIDF